jgi:hypothetical protein
VRTGAGVGCGVGCCCKNHNVSSQKFVKTLKTNTKKKPVTGVGLGVFFVVV